jgi:hypothetical protein
MSHFTVGVITPAKPTDDELKAALQPFHEFECTGEDDQYVTDVDVTDELATDYQKYEAARAAEEQREPRPFDEWVVGWTSAEKREDGRWYRHTNPNAKWDWWTVGGRWAGMIALRDGKSADQARIGDIDLSRRAYDANEAFSTFAVVKDGEWYECGRMGWFACVSDAKPEGEWETELQKLLAANPDAWLTVVDCHI